MMLVCVCVRVDVTEDAEQLQDRLVYCYPVRLSVPSPPHPRVELHFENDVACLRFKGEKVNLCVTTLGGVESDITVIAYKCSVWFYCKLG